MASMELLKWQSVIVEWVNCLNLSKPVQTISDLKNEDFFRKLLLFITPNQNDSLGSSLEDTSLTDFLKKHYPAYSLEVEPTIMQDDIEICNICSLLLHYCCFIDGREELTVPLCKELNTTIQFHIKSFLEDLQEANEITRDLLTDAILNIGKYSTPVKLKNSPFASPKIIGNTPLVDFLKTPFKKQFFDSHKKEIKHLQAQLDLERYEKADLQEELNLQYEKNKKLDKIISNKQNEISRMRSELLALESRTPPSNTKADGRLENKRLREEITSLEKYVEILHQEQEEVQNERDKAREKLRKVEEHCNDWQSRALNSERQCSTLSDENEFQRNELFQLREKCEELSSILKEINARNVCDESYEIDHMHPDFIQNRSGSIDYDNLAHTVVDVQLIDAQEENKGLRKQLGELEINTTELSTQMNQLQTEIAKIMEENKNLTDNNKKLTQKILDTEIQLEECRHTLKESQVEQETLNLNIVELKQKLSETQFNLSYYENEHETLETDLKSLKESSKNVSDQLKQKNKDFDHLLSEKSKLHSYLDEATQKLLYFEEENVVLKEFFDKFNKTFDETLSKAAEKTSGNDNILKLKELITALENKIKNDSKRIQQLEEENKSLTDQKSTLQLEVAKLIGDNESLQVFLDKFNNVFEFCLKKFEANLKEFVMDTSENDNIYKLQNLLTSLENKMNKDAQNFRQLQENSNALLSRVTSLQEEVTKLYNNEIDSQKEKSNLKICLDDSKKKIQHQEEEIDNNNKLLLICKSTIEEKSSEISSLKDVIISKDKYIEDLNKQKCELSNNLEALENKLSEEERAKNLANKKINILMVSLQDTETKILLFEESIAEYKSTVEEKLSEISSLKNVIINKDKFIEALNNDLLQEKQAKENVNNELVSLNKSLQKRESKIHKLKLDIAAKSSEISELENFVAAKNKLIDNLNNEKHNLTACLKSAENKLSEETDAKQFAEAKIKSLTSTVEDLESKLQNQMVVIEDNNKLLETYKLTIEERSNEFSNTIATKNELIANLDKEKCDLTSTLETVENKLLEETRIKKSAQKEICNLEAVINKNNESIERFKLIIDEKSSELKELTALKDKLMENLNKEKCELATALETVENKLLAEISVKELAETNCQKLKENLIEKENCILSLETQKTALENNIQLLNKEILNEKESKTSLEEKCTNLQTIIANVEEQMQVLQKDRTKLNHQLDKVKQESDYVNQNLNEIQSNNKDLSKLLSEKDKHLQNLETVKQNLNVKAEKLEKELQNAEESNSVFKVKLEEMTRILEEKSEHISSLEAEKEDLQKQIVILENDLLQTVKQKDNVEMQLNDLTQSLNQKETIINSLEKDKNIIQEQIETLNNNLTSQELQLSNKITEHFKRNQELQTEIDNLNQNFNMLNIEVSTIVNMLKTEEDIHVVFEQIHSGDSFGELSKTISTLKNNICSLIFEKRRLDNETSSLQQHIVDVESLKAAGEEESAKKIEYLSERNKELQMDKDKYKMQIETYRNKLEDAKSDVEKTVSNAEKLLVEHSRELETYQKDIKMLQDQIHGLEEQLKQYKHRESNMTKELLSVKIELKDSLKNEDDMKHVIEHLEKMIQDLKEDLRSKFHELSDQEERINELNLRLSENIQEVMSLNDEKNKFVSQLLEISASLNSLEQTRQEMSEEIEEKNSVAEETMKIMKIDFKSSIEALGKKHLEDLKIRNQLEDHVESLTKQLADISSDNNNLITLCNESNNKIHSIYTILFEKHDEKEIAGKEFDLIVNEIKKTIEHLSNYETLKVKYDHLLACESELLETKTKLSNLHLENTRYQKQLSEKEVDYKSSKSRYEEEIDLMKSTCANWQKIIKENETEHKKLQNDHQNLKEKFDTEFQSLQKTKTKLEETVCDLEQQIKHNNNLIIEHQTKFEDLNSKYESATQKISTLDPEVINLQDKINNYKKLITDLETQNMNLHKNLNDLSEQHKLFTEKCRTQHNQIDNDELTKLRKAYTDLLADNSRLQLECTVLKKTLEDRNTQLSNLSVMKDSYEKLLEENNKVNMEIDTLRYKRTRDKEEFKRVLEEAMTKSEQQIQEVKSEYEEKLKKMKEKIVKLYREEVEREKKKFCTLQQGQAEEAISALKSQLWVTSNKYVDTKKENEKLREQLSKFKDNHQIELLEISRGSDIHGSRDSVCSLRERRRPIREVEERRTSTLPKDMKASYAPPQQIDIIEESVTISRKRRSITAIPKNLDPGLKMEDEEGEVFNNTYLADLKAGRCVVSDRDPNNRVSELQFRNSLCPPHLKSSYPAETQFASPGHFKEEDIKMGPVDLDDSMSSSLLPGDKPRTKKDWGQTLYKKPGPPTPSKNGGRLSLQGNEVHPRDVLRDHNPGRTVSTPSRIKALFSRSGASSRDTENVSSTPRGATKRRSIFRR